MFCYQPEKTDPYYIAGVYNSKTEIMTSTMFWMLVNSPQVAWLVKKHREVKSSLSDPKWLDDADFMEYDRKMRAKLYKTKYDECYERLPETFTATNVLEVYGLTTQDAAQQVCSRLYKDKAVNRVKRGTYKKIKQSLVTSPSSINPVNLKVAVFLFMLRLVLCDKGRGAFF